MLKTTGWMLLLVGMAAGAALVGAPFGVPGASAPSPAAWILFPGGFVAGALLIALGGPAGSFAALLRVCAMLLLALAGASLLGLALPMLGLVEADGSTVSLWYVLVLAGALGTACALRPTVPGPSGT